MGSQKLKHKIQRLANDWGFPLMREQNILYLLYYRQMVRVTLGYEKRRFANAKIHFHVPAMNKWMIYRSKKSTTAKGVVVISIVLSSSLDVDGLIKKLRSYSIDCSICSSLEWNGSEKNVCYVRQSSNNLCTIRTDGINFTLFVVFRWTKTRVNWKANSHFSYNLAIAFVSVCSKRYIETGDCTTNKIAWVGVLEMC